MTEDDKVRPLPPDSSSDPTDAIGEARGRPGAPGSGSGSRAAAVAVVALIGGLAIGLLAAGVGRPPNVATNAATTTTIPSLVGAGGPDPLTTTSPTTTQPPTTTTTLPPRLSDLIPRFEGRLIVVGRDADGPFTATWNDRQRAPRRLIELQSPEHAALDADRRLLAYLGLRDGEEFVLFTGPIAGAVATPLAAQVNAVAWHHREPSRLAWSGTGLLDSTNALFTATLDGGGSPDATGVQRLVSLPSQSRLMAWGDWGFFISEGAWLVLLDLDGTEQTRLPARYHDTNGQHTLVETVTEAAGNEFPDGVWVSDQSLIPAPETRVLPSGSTYALSPDGLWAVRLTPDGSNLEVHGVTRRFRRLISAGGGEVTGFSDSGRFVLVNVGQVYAVDWSNLRIHALPIWGKLAAVVLED